MTPGMLTRDLELHLSVNPSSPHFARLAEALLRNGEISRAESLCEKGLELYPHYPTGRLIHARCLAARGRYEGALASLNEVVAHYPGNIALWQLEEEWRDLVALQPEPGPDDAAVFTDLSVAATHESDASVVEIPEASAAEPDMDSGMVTPDVATEERVEPAVTAGESPATDIETLRVSGNGIYEIVTGAGVPAPMPVPSIHAEPVPLLQSVPPSWKPAGFIEPDRIVSRTLAEIYANQGAIDEAVETYRILLNRMPERREMLEGRLRELEKRLRIDPGRRPTPTE